MPPRCLAAQPPSCRRSAAHPPSCPAAWLLCCPGIAPGWQPVFPACLCQAAAWVGAWPHGPAFPSRHALGLQALQFSCNTQQRGCGGPTQPRACGGGSARCALGLHCGNKGRAAQQPDLGAHQGVGMMRTVQLMLGATGMVKFPSHFLKQPWEPHASRERQKKLPLQ